MKAFTHGNKKFTPLIATKQDLGMYSILAKEFYESGILLKPEPKDK